MARISTEEMAKRRRDAFSQIDVEQTTVYVSLGNLIELCRDIGEMSYDYAVAAYGNDLNNDTHRALCLAWTRAINQKV